MLNTFFFSNYILPIVCLSIHSVQIALLGHLNITFCQNHFGKNVFYEYDTEKKISAWKILISKLIFFSGILTPRTFIYIRCFLLLLTSTFLNNYVSFYVKYYWTYLADFIKHMYCPNFLNSVVFRAAFIQRYEVECQK